MRKIPFQKRFVIVMIVMFVSGIFVPNISANMLKTNNTPSSNYFKNAVEQENHPPDAPVIKGPIHGRVGITYEWTIVSTDLDGDHVTYYVDWGDECGGAEWHGPYPSGEEVTITHKYTFRNNFIINAMAEDEHGAGSDWTYFKFSTPRNRILHNSIIDWLLDRFPISRIFFRYCLQ